MIVKLVPGMHKRQTDLSLVLLLTGSLDLHSCIAVVSHDKKIKGHTFVLNIIIGRGSTARIHHLATTSNEERNEWITALNEFIFTMPVVGVPYTSQHYRMASFTTLYYLFTAGLTKILWQR